MPGKTSVNPCGKTNFNYAIYHKSCLDGFSSFFVAHLSGRLTRDVTVYPDVPSTVTVPPDIAGMDLVILDVAYKKEVLEQIFKYAKSVLFIDHHHSIKNDVDVLHKKYNTNNNITIVYDEARCGATLTWKYFFTRQEIPLFLKYVEDQDTGKWIHPNTKPFIYAVRVYYRLSQDSKSLNRWLRLMNKENVAKLVKKGKYMQRYNEHLVNVNLPRYTLQRFPSKQIYLLARSLVPGANVSMRPGQYRVAVYCGMNCPSVTELASAALGSIDCDFCIMWTYHLDTKKYVLSMRSKEVDVSAICRIFGGGGHKLAAACSFQHDDYDIDDMFYIG
jgi:oligoribonuclease NrnB/cAMP/cGMP phosphodiesterase (DHH superfamily)